MAKSKPEVIKLTQYPQKLKYTDVKNWIWDYFNDDIKIFVPKQFKLSFQQYVKTNKLKVVQSASYGVASIDQLKLHPKKYKYQIGKDYISSNKNKNLFIVWLKTAIKEV